MNLEELTNLSDSPVALSVTVSTFFHSIIHTIFFQLDYQTANKTIDFHCGMPTVYKSQKQFDESNGWCSTEEDKHGNNN